MVLFSYTARDEKGTLLRGTLDAPDMDTARKALVSMKLKEEEMYQIAYDSANKPVESPPGHPMPPVGSFDSNFQRAVPAVGVPPGQKPAVGMPAGQQPQPIPVGVTPPKGKGKVHTTVDTRSALPATSKHLQKDSGGGDYYPMWQSLRLYAGWLLAWYGLVFALGNYQNSRTLSFTIPYLNGIFRSPLVLTLALISFLYLLMTQLYIQIDEGTDEIPRFTGLGLSLFGIVLFVLYRANV